MSQRGKGCVYYFFWPVDCFYCLGRSVIVVLEVVRLTCLVRWLVVEVISPCFCVDAFGVR